MSLKQILIRPLVTEKTSAMRANNTYVFKVAPRSSKIELRKLIEKLFSIKVKRVRIVNYRPRVKKSQLRRRQASKISGERRAYVRLQEGQTIKELSL